MSARQTRNRILDTAEVLFAERGIAGTSLRVITKAAEVNLAAVHYHFGSKEALLDAVIERRARPVNRERVRILKAMIDDACGEPLEVEDILAAWLAPAIQGQALLTEQSPALTRLLVKIEAQAPETVESLFRRNFGEVSRLYVEQLQSALPHLPKEVVAERFRFAFGAISFLFSGNFDLDTIHGHPSSLDDFAGRIQRLIVFLGVGFRCPDLRFDLAGRLPS